MAYKNQLVYGEQGLIDVEEMLRKLGFAEASVTDPHLLQSGQYIKVLAAGGPFNIPHMGIIYKAWNVYWLAKE